MKLFSFFPWGPATEPWRMLCIDLETNRWLSRSFAEEEGKLADAPNLSTATSSQESFTWTFLCTKHFGTTSLVQKYKTHDQLILGRAFQKKVPIQSSKFRLREGWLFVEICNPKQWRVTSSQDQKSPLFFFFHARDYLISVQVVQIFALTASRWKNTSFGSLTSSSRFST